jgi:hypothetical protein
MIISGTSSDSNLLVQECETAFVYEFPAISNTGSNAYVEWTVSQDAIGYGFMFAFLQGVGNFILVLVENIESKTGWRNY